MKRCNSSVVLALGIALGLAAPTWAQDKTDFTVLQTTLKQADKVTLTTISGDKINGRLLDLSSDRITLQLKDGPRSVGAVQVQQVKKRKNGVLLGAVIGVGAAIPVSLAVAAYARNEGGRGPIALIPIAIGLGAGIGLDAAIGSNKILYERQSGRSVTVAPLINPRGGIGGRVAFKF